MSWTHRVGLATLDIFDLEEIEKRNPYRDARGRFCSKENAVYVLLSDKKGSFPAIARQQEEARGRAEEAKWRAAEEARIAQEAKAAAAKAKAEKRRLAAAERRKAKKAEEKARITELLKAEVPADYTKFSRATLDKQSVPVKPEEVNAADIYQGSGFRSWNEHLRGVDVSPSVVNGGPGAGRIKALQGLIDRASLPGDAKLYRGIRDAESVFGTSDFRSLIGKTWVDKGFMSTSTDRSVAWDFGNSFDGKTPMRFEVFAPKGTKGLGMSAVVSGYEREILLQSGTVLKFVDYDPNMNIMRAVVVKQTKTKLDDNGYVVMKSEDEIGSGRKDKRPDPSKFQWGGGDMALVGDDPEFRAEWEAEQAAKKSSK